MNSYITIFRQHPELFFFSALLFGGVVGSFLNVVIYRLPTMLYRGWRVEALHTLGLPEAEDGLSVPYNLCWPGSACPHCRARIGVADNIPVISWLFLRGRCRHCQNPISFRYPLIEALTALLTLWVAIIYGPWPTALWGFLLLWFLIVLAFIDLDHLLLPDCVTLPLLWAGLVANLWGTFVPIHDAVLGAMLGYASLWLVYQIHRRLRGREGMGYGDFKLFAAIGAWLGYSMLLPTLMIASLFSILSALMLRVLSGSRVDHLPFGPGLALGGFICLLYGHEIVIWWSMRVFSIHAFG